MEESIRTSDKKKKHSEEWVEGLVTHLESCLKLEKSKIER